MEDKQSFVRDYSLIGSESMTAVQKGLADATWYTTPITREKMRELLVRKDGPAIRDTLLWFGLILGSGYLVFLWWGTWLAILPYIVYSVLYASTSDSRWHESSHGTAFKTDWMNNFLYEVSSFMVLRQSTVWRYSHARHHSDTIIRGRDPEIAVPRPPDIKKLVLVFFGISSSIPEWKKLLTHASGKIDPQVATYVPKSEHRTVIFKARIYVAIFLLVIGLSIAYQSILPLMYIGFPTLLGSWLMPVYGLTQHAGLQENVLDHRLNCRTVYMNRIHRYLYWNMNYHVEHHMFPLVPYHALPRLHELMKHDCPEPYHGIVETFKEIIPAILKQVKDPWYYVERKLPEKQAQIELQENWINGDQAAVVDGKIEVCTVADLNKGDVVRFDYQQRTYAVYRTDQDHFYATDGICTHGNAHLSDGVMIGDVIECAKHNGRFDLKDGSPKRVPVCIAVNTYEVEVADEKVYLKLDSIEKQQDDQNDVATFKVISNKNVATFIKELVLEPEEGQTFNFQPGQYVQLVVPPHQTSFEQLDVDEPFRQTWEEMELFKYGAHNKIYLKRNYSLATNPSAERQLRFNIRLSLPPQGTVVNAGLGSTYAFSLQPGDQVKLTGPFGDFLIKDTDREMVYIGGGAGMAPLRSHLAYLFETANTKRKVSFWYGARSLDEAFYQDYFEDMEREHDNFFYQLALSEPKSKDHWTGPTGFVSDVAFAQYLKDHPNPQNIEYYLCGPPAMIQTALRLLDQLGVSDEMIAYDEF